MGEAEEIAGIETVKARMEDFPGPAPERHRSGEHSAAFARSLSFRYPCDLFRNWRMQGACRRSFTRRSLTLERKRETDLDLIRACAPGP